MSALAKKLHVHFDDDVSVSSMSKIKSNEQIADRKKDASILNYTRDELFELAKNKLSLVPPTFPDDIKDADEKRKQKIKSVFKNADVLKSLYESKYIWLFSRLFSFSVFLCLDFVVVVDGLRDSIYVVIKKKSAH